MGTKKTHGLQNCEKTLKIDYLSSVVIRFCDIFLSIPSKRSRPWSKFCTSNPSLGRSDRDEDKESTKVSAWDEKHKKDGHLNRS